VSGSVAAIRDPDTHVRGAVLVLRDIGERRRIEEELARSDKLESLGVLAGGIAHDFNNVLAAILGNLSLARARTDDDRVADCLARAGEAASRARELTAQLLTFSRGGAPVKRLAALGQLVPDAAHFILSGSASNVEVDVAPDLWPAEVDGGQFVQVVHNLTLNASQAMPAGGTVRISLRNVPLGPGDPSGLDPGDYVRMEVADQGLGIPRDLQSRIFEPFFTTKARGTGLGLSICYSIVTRHGGWIGVDSEPSKGTTFRVLLPASPTGRIEEAAPEARGKASGGGPILVMDDNDLVRATVESELEFLGYSPTGTRDGDEAVAAYEAAFRQGRPFRAVILDLTVPGGMGGLDTLACLRRIDPGVVALVFSGYSSVPPQAEPDTAGFAGALTKPYTMQQLAMALEKAFEGRSREPAS
jgi:nitrogen-specific signal transduction histidine kinase/CheY-like chemotaxis protein